MAVLIAAAAFPQSALFTLERIEVLGASTLSPEAVVGLSGLRRGERLFAVNAAAASRRLRAHPRIKAAEVHVRPPHAVAISVTERQPVVALATGDGFALLDRDLIIVALTGDAAGLPQVTDRLGLPAYRVRAGAPLPSEGARIAVAALAAVPPGLRDEVMKISVAAGPDLILVTRAGLEIRAGGLAGLAERLAQVPGVLEALRARKVAVAAIDLRYAGSIVVKPSLGGDGR